MSDRIKSVLNEILKRFESGDIPEAVALSTYPVSDIPSSRWSFLNRLLMTIAGTSDARGYRQWQSVNRHVKKGARAVHIIVPKMVRKDAATGDDEQILKGFLAKPVFKFEDTDGQPLTVSDLELPDIPLLDKAAEFGIKVKAIPGNNTYFGYFSASNGEIALASKEESVFFHELSHAAHSRLPGYKDKDGWIKEIVAELSAAALCRIVGKSSKHLGNSYRYIKHYAKKANLSPIKACLDVLHEVEASLRLILPGPA